MPFDAAYAVKCIKEKTKYDHVSVKELGKGTFGRIYAICEAKHKEEDDCMEIVKIIYRGNEAEIQKELAVAELLNKSDLTPTLHSHFKCGEYTFIIMDRYASNLASYAKAKYREFKSEITKLGGGRWQEKELYPDDILMDMFRIAYNMGEQYNVIHGDLKPDQYLISQQDRVIRVTDFGFSGTGDGKIPAFRGWSCLGECGNFQPLPPAEMQGKTFAKYFNMYQLWTYLACGTYPTLVVDIDDNTDEPKLTFYYISSQQYPFQKGHRFYIPPLVFEFLTSLENQFGIDQGISRCPDQKLFDTITSLIPASVRPWIVH